jgi:hypothetical protein
LAAVYSSLAVIQETTGLPPSQALEKSAMARRASYATRYSMSRDVLSPFGRASPGATTPLDGLSPTAVIPNFQFSFDFFEKSGSFDRTHKRAHEASASSVKGSVEPAPQGVTRTRRPSQFCRLCLLQRILTRQ